MQLKGDQHISTLQLSLKIKTDPVEVEKKGKNMFVRTSSNLPVNKFQLCYLYYIWLAHCQHRNPTN
jgi:hypothetical protein